MKGISPPRFGKRLVSLLFDPFLQESIEGDLYEIFLEDLENVGQTKARRRYLINILLFLRYHRLRNSKTQHSNQMGLFNNYLKVALRDLRRHKLFTAINLFGLVAGFTVSLFMFEYVIHEISFDRFHSKADRIYRVINDRYQNGELIQHGNITYPTIGRLMKKDFPEVIQSTRMLPDWSHVEFRDQILISEEVLIADEHIFSVLDFEILHGDKETSNLDEAFEVILTESFARRLIGKEESLESLVNETIEFDRNGPSKITAIVADPPVNSQLQFDLLQSYATYISYNGEAADNSMQWSDFYHYILVDENADIDVLHGKVASFGDRYFGEGEVSGTKEKFYLQPLIGSHLDPNNEYEIANVVDGRVVWSMLFIAIVIVLVAWINFTNLSSSRVLQRAKEVGVRKSLGAGKRQIVAQISLESLILNFGSLAISILLCLLFQPFFNSFLDLSLSLKDLLAARMLGIPFPILFICCFTFLVLLISVYPGSIIAAFRLQDVIKGVYKTKGEVRGFKHLLVVFQYCISLLLIVGAVGVGRQINFMMEKDLGISIEKTMVLNGPGLTQWDSTFIHKIERLKSDLSSLSGVSNATSSNRVAGNKMGRIFRIQSPADPEAKNLTSNFFNVNHDFAETFDLQIVAGRDFESTDHHYDWRRIRNIMINESAVDLLKFKDPEDAIGKTLSFWNGEFTIIGVVNDFHQLSMHHAIEPVIFRPSYGTYNDVIVKLTAPPTEGLLSSIQQKYLEIFPGNYYDYYFLEDQFMTQYEGEKRVSKIVNIFTMLSIVIAVLGLYGLILISISKRTKEIGLRRVLGASLHQIVFTVGRELLLLVSVAIVIGGPMSYFLMEQWQSSFAYSIGIDVAIIALASVVLFVLAVSVLFAQMLQVAKVNPSESLRYE